MDERELYWLKDHPVVTFTGDPNWLPYEAFDGKGEYIGIVAEHLKLISKISGLTFKKTLTKTWTESTNLAKSGAVDILSETDDSALKSHLKFTNSYISNPIVIAMHNRENYVAGISEIKGKKIGLIRDYGYATKFREKYKNINFVTVEDIQDGLVSVSTGKIDALVCTLALCSYTISQLNLNNVRITGKTEFETKLAFGIQKHHSELLSIMNKSIALITRTQQQKILDFWIKTKYVDRIDYSLVYNVLGGALTFLLIFFFWNRRLKKEINLRRSAEIELNHYQEQLEELVKIRTEALVKSRVETQSAKEIVTKKDAKIREKETAIAMLFENSPFGFAFTDKKGKMIEINGKYSEIVGYELSEILKLSHRDITPQKYEKLEKEQLDLLDNTGAYGPYRKEYVQKDGNLVSVELTGFLLQYQGVEGIFSIVQDITDKIQSEANLEKQRQTILRKSKLASIGELAAGVGHEINNPLAIVSGNITLLKKMLTKETVNTEMFGKQLIKVEMAIVRIKKIVDGLRTYGRADSGKVVLISVDEALSQTLFLITEIYEKDDILLTLTTEDSDLFAMGVFGELQQVIMNLLSNAKDATIDSKSRIINLSQKLVGENVVLSVRDNGEGVSDHIKERIFEPFFTTKPAGIGTGIGLGLSSQLITKIGGKLTVESVEGEGSTFSILLPSKPAPTE